MEDRPTIDTLATTRVLILAQYAAVRAGLHALLADEDGIEVVGTISTAAELENALGSTRADVILYDQHNADAQRVFDLTSGAESALVVLGEDPAGAQEVADQPIRGWAYLLKEAGAAEIAAAIRAAAAGLVALDRSLVPIFQRRLVPTLASESLGTTVAGDALTAREMEVLQLMAQGLPNKTIAARLKISQNTAKFHVASVLGKLGASSRTEAVTLGVRRGLVSL